MADLATLKSWLVEAETALHKLHLGDQRVSVTKDGRTMQFTANDSDKLEKYINRLSSDITRIEGGSRRGIIYPIL